jgi:signal transduction histidine kinase
MTGLENKFTEVETLASALEKTNEFLEKLLWWSRAQLQDWVPEQVPIDLSRVLDQSLALVRSAAEMKEIAIHCDPLPYPRPLADPESVQLILGNLLSNAVKFSLPGRPIRVSVGTELDLCTISILDEGVGMDPATIDRLFRIEDKLTTHGTGGERGSGLGLILAQSLAERNNGGITIESLPGKGTKATLWLPT